jgi:hypothetical protein
LNVLFTCIITLANLADRSDLQSTVRFQNRKRSISLFHRLFHARYLSKIVQLPLFRSNGIREQMIDIGSGSLIIRMVILHPIIFQTTIILTSWYAFS